MMASCHFQTSILTLFVELQANMRELVPLVWLDTRLWLWGSKLQHSSETIHAPPFAPQVMEHDIAKQRHEKHDEKKIWSKALLERWQHIIWAMHVLIHQKEKKHSENRKVLPSSLHRIFATAAWWRGEKEGGTFNLFREGDWSSRRDVAHDTQGLNIFDSYKIFLPGVDSIIFPPNSRDQVIDYSVILFPGMDGPLVKHDAIEWNSKYQRSINDGIWLHVNEVSAKKNWQWNGVNDSCVE